MRHRPGLRPGALSSSPPPLPSQILMTTRGWPPVSRIPPPHPHRYSVYLDGCQVLLVGTIQGLKGEAARVRDAWDRLGGAEAIALGVGAEDVANLQRMGETPGAVDEFLAQELDTGSYEEAILPQLSQFGDIVMPPDDLLAAEALSRGSDVALVPLDLDDEAHSDLYVKHLSGWQMVRGQMKQKRLVGRGGDAAGSAEELMLLWDHTFRSLPGYARVEEDREAHMEAGVRELAHRYDRLLVVLPYARVVGMARRLGASAETN